DAHAHAISESLREIQRHEVGPVRVLDAGEEERRVHREQRAADAVDAVAVVPLTLRRQAEVVADAESGEIDTRERVELAAVLPRLLALPTRHALIELA